MAESNNEAQDHVTQRIRHVSECQTMDEVQDLLQKTLCSLKCAKMKVQAADGGMCTVRNTKTKNLAELKELHEECTKALEHLGHVFLNHMEQRHPVVGTGRAADSGYSSQIISSSSQYGLAELAPYSLDQPQALTITPGFTPLHVPIQEEGELTNC